MVFAEWCQEMAKHKIHADHHLHGTEKKKKKIH